MITDVLNKINGQCSQLSLDIGLVAYQGKDLAKCLEVMKALEHVRYLCDQAMEAEVPDE